jgi:hypothetical protein
MREVDSVIEGAINAQVTDEVSTNKIIPSLMTKAAAEAGDNPELTKSRYIQLRAQQIRREMNEPTGKDRVVSPGTNTAACASRTGSFQRRPVETLKELSSRRIPLAGYASGFLWVTVIYWLGSIAYVGNWPGLRHIPTSELVTSFRIAAFLPTFVASMLWLPIWALLYVRKKKSKHALILPILIVSFLLVVLELAGVSSILGTVWNGKKRAYRGGPWSCLMSLNHYQSRTSRSLWDFEIAEAWDYLRRK